MNVVRLPALKFFAQLITCFDALVFTMNTNKIFKKKKFGITNGNLPCQIYDNYKFIQTFNIIFFVSILNMRNVSAGSEHSWLFSFAELSLNLRHSTFSTSHIWTPCCVCQNKLLYLTNNIYSGLRKMHPFKIQKCNFAKYCKLISRVK